MYWPYMKTAYLFQVLMCSQLISLLPIEDAERFVVACLFVFCCCFSLPFSQLFSLLPALRGGSDIAFE